MILVLDNYDSFTYNLVHLVGRYHSEVTVYRSDALSWPDVKAMRPDGILISPGPGRPADAGICKDVIKHLAPEVPMLGICLGHQAIAEACGATITYASSLMHGKTSTIRHDGITIFAGVDREFTATRYHSLVVERASLPAVLQVSAESPDGTVMGLRHRKWPLEGVQFHPESVMTVAGPRIVANWVALVGKWKPEPALHP